MVFELISRIARRYLLPAICVLGGPVVLQGADWAGDYTPPPAAYYTDAEGLFDEDLRRALYGLIAPHTVLSYNDVATAVRVLDRDPENLNNILLLYSETSVGQFTNWGAWNREHLWPQSYGASVIPAYTDFHHLYPCDPGVNSTRSNFGFDWLPMGSPASGAPRARIDFSRSLFEPPDSDKGRVARAMLYMDLRYDGSEWAASGGNQTSDLRLGTFRDRSTPGVNRFNSLPALLEWNRMFTPDLRERRRNHIVHNGFQSGNRLIIQGNRNPFADHPELADALFVGDDYLTWFTWKVEHFPMSAWRDFEQTDPLVFAGQSPVPLLLEFSQDLAPGSAEPANLPFVARRFSGRVTDFHFTEIRQAALSGVEYFVEYSETPLTETSWQTYDYAQTFVSVTSSTPLTRTLRVSDSGLPSAERPRHFRLRVHMHYPVDDPTMAIFDPVADFNESGSIFAYFETDAMGRRLTDWLGPVDDQAYPFVTHDSHGTVWVSAEDEEAVWIFDLSLGWLFTGRLVHPHYYSFSRATWLTFVEETADPLRLFYDWSIGQFIPVQSRLRNFSSHP